MENPLVNFKVERSMTINIGNFESIKPLVGVEVLGVPVENVDIVYKEVGEILDKLVQLEQANLYIEMKEIKRTGISEHIKSIIEQDFDALRGDIKVSLNIIKTVIKKGK